MPVQSLRPPRPPASKVGYAPSSALSHIPGDDGWPIGGEDLFSQLCRATWDDGSLLSNADIADHMSFLMMAAHDTLTSSLTSFVYRLAANPDWQEKVREEQRGLGLAVDEPLPFDRLDDLVITEMAFKEAMRMAPPVPSIPRRAVREFEFMGYCIPAGTGVNVNPLYTHYMPQLWPEPDRYDPTRFTTEASRSRHKFAFVPFGGGAHMCLGLNFAYMQAKCFTWYFLNNFGSRCRPIIVRAGACGRSRSRATDYRCRSPRRKA